MELNTISLDDFVKLAAVIFKKGELSIPQIMRNSGFFNVSSISQNTGNTREFSEIDLEEYADNKGQSAQSERAKVQQGLILGLVKSSLINGENLKTVIKRFKATLRKTYSHLQRLSERTQINFCEATVRTA